MPFEPIYGCLHMPSPQLIVDPTFKNRLYEHAQRVKHRSSARQYEHYGEHPVPTGDAADLLVAHSAHGDDRLVNRIAQGQPQGRIAYSTAEHHSGLTGSVQTEFVSRDHGAGRLGRHRPLCPFQSSCRTLQASKPEQCQHAPQRNHRTTHKRTLGQREPNPRGPRFNRLDSDILPVQRDPHPAGLCPLDMSRPVNSARILT